MNCRHSVIFNYANGKSRCGECGAEFIMTRSGQRLNADALEEMYEALRGIMQCRQTVGGGELERVKQALAKVEGGK